jgi:uncharacterized membrane protein
MSGTTARGARVIDHAFTSYRSVVRAFPDAALTRIEAAVAAAEMGTNGQIRIAIEASLPLIAVNAGYRARDRAIDVFSQLRVWDTENNNGVLIYLLMAERDVEIVADRGIHRCVGPSRWTQMCTQMEDRFRRGEFEAGVIEGARAVGAALSAHFPEDNARNEQPNRPTILR